jgi:hypothetical protein
MRRKETSYIEYFINEKGIHIPLRCFLLESGKYTVHKKQLYNHVVPTFNRLFLFKQGWAHLESANGKYVLRSNTIYLLPVNFSFKVTYDLNSEFYYFHVNSLDGLHYSDSTPQLFASIAENYTRDDLEFATATGPTPALPPFQGF